MTTMRHARLALTADLVAQTIREIADAGMVPGTVAMTDDDYKKGASALLAKAVARSLDYIVMRS